MLIRTRRTIEPPVAARIAPGHRLAHGLAGCWLLNEGAGRRVHDVSSRFHHGIFSGGPQWVSGSCGHAVTFDGYDDWISMGDCLDLGTDDITLLCLVSFSAANQPEQWSGISFGAIAGKGYLGSSNKGYGLFVRNDRIAWQIRKQSEGYLVVSDGACNDGRYHVAVGVCDRDSSTGMRLYIDGVQQANAEDPTSLLGIDLSGSQAFGVGSASQEAGGWCWDLLGTVAAVYVWKRVLTDSEITRLARDPFAFFARRGPLWYGLSSTGSTVDLAGSASGQSTSTATLQRARGISGTVQCTCTATGSLDVTPAAPPQPVIARTDAPWLREALFHGSTATAFQLGTVLTQGWFWVRRQGCQVVYRGPNLASIDFGHMLGVVDIGVTDFCLPRWLSHEPDATYCYLIQRFNACGAREKTTGAAVAVHIGSDGQLAAPEPNRVFGLKAEPTTEGTVRLTWLYTPIDQAVAPERINVYADAGSGQIDLEEPVAVLNYRGRRFYFHECRVAADGTYTWLVRAESGTGTEGPPSPPMVRQVRCSFVPPPLVLAADAI